MPVHPRPKKRKKIGRKGFIELQGVALGFTLVTTIMVAISQLPSVKQDFRHKKAVEQCYSEGGVHCNVFASSLSKNELLAYIKDDSTVGNGGNFHNGYMN